MTIAIGRLKAAKRNVTARDSQVCLSASIRWKFSRPTNRSGWSWARLMFVTLKINEAIIGNKVNARNPKIHGDRKMRPQRASFRARADLPSDGRRNQPRRSMRGGITGGRGTAAKRPPG